MISNTCEVEILKRIDVTAVSFYNSDVVLIAVGGTVHLYQISVDQIRDTRVILRGQKIHGFIVEKTSKHTVAYGGKDLILLNIKLDIPFSNEVENISKSYSIEKVENYIKCNDWIQAVCWAHTNKSLAVLTSHNIVQVWDLETKHEKHYEPEEICILYCGYLYKLLDSVLVFAGTVFSQVSVYSLDKRKPLHVLIGHKGVIFSVVWNEEHRIIVTTSDDRSLKIWSVQSTSHEQSPKTLSYWKESEITCRYSLFGHTARVWRGLVTKDFVVSIGEDSKIGVWTLDGKLYKKIKTHQGGCLWSISYSYELNRIVTGGGDGGVILQPAALLQNADENKNKIFLHTNEVLKKISITQCGNIVCLTDDLRIVYCNVAKNTFNCIHERDNMGKIILMATSLDRSCFAFVDLRGVVNIFKEIKATLQHTTSIQVLETRILSIHWADEEYLVICSLNGNINIFYVEKETGAQRMFCNFTLPWCKERWLTAAAMKTFDETSHCFLFGDRCGNFHLYRRGLDAPLRTLRKVHGHLGVNSVHLIGNILSTTGRDGSLKYYKLTRHDLTYFYQSKVPFEWVERVFNEHELVCGFRESSLIVYDNYVHQEIVDLNCGGGHRSWDLKSNEGGTLQICYIKSGNIHFYNIAKADITPKLIVKGTHIKEINSMKIIEINDNTKLIISGSEDTSLRISLLQFGSPACFKELVILRQLSNIRSISVQRLHSTLDKCEYLFAASGGRAEICIRKLSVHKVNGVVSTDIEDVCFYMLKGNDKQRKGSKSWQKLETDFDPEMRFMSIEIVAFDAKLKSSNSVYNNSRIILFAGCSDACFRVYELKKEHNIHVLENLVMLKFHKKCILKVKLFQIEGVVFVVTMGTDGLIVFWNGTDIIENFHNNKDFSPVSHFKLHKSGINDCDIYNFESNLIAIATGGDDNCVNLNIFKVIIANDFKIFIDRLATMSRDQWHCAQVTGIKFMNDHKLFSTSIDQRVTLMSWNYDIFTKEITMDFLRQLICDVSDVQGIDLCLNKMESGVLCIYGKGFSIIEFG